MLFIPHFDIAALCIEVLIFIFTALKRNLPILKNKIYTALVVLITVVTILDFTTELIGIENPESWPAWALWLLNGLYLCGMPGIPVAYTAYCLALVGFWDDINPKKRQKAFLFLVIPYLITACFVVISPFLNSKAAVYTINEYHIYERGGLSFIILYAVSGLYLLSTLVIIIKFRKNLTKNMIVMMISFILAIIIPVALQFIFQGLLTTCFGISLGCLAFIVFIQQTEIYLDGTLNIFNRNGFNIMEQEYFRKKSSHACIGIIIDDTVFLNNTYGFHQFNALMKEVSDFLKANFKFSEIFTISQGSFCLLLERADEKKIRNAINIVKQRFSHTWLENSINQRLFARVCVIECPEAAKTQEDVTDILSAVSSDVRYKMPLIFAKDVKLEDKKEMTHIEHCVRNGLAANLFEVYYQPIYSTADKKVVGAEALLRLKDETGKFLDPEVFVPIAEKNGTITRIGEFVFETVCKTLSNLDIKRLGIKKIDINLSVAQCMQESLSGLIKTIREIYQVPVEILNLEITESASAHTPEILLKNMNELSEAGFELSMDDYGSGYSNMGYLLNLPFKMIKIDKFIVWAAFKNKLASIALQKTIQMIKALGKTVLAEGVETEEHMNWLSEAGCDYLQGYYFGKGMPLAEYVQYMKEHHMENFQNEAKEDENLEILEDVEELKEEV